MVVNVNRASVTETQSAPAVESFETIPKQAIPRGAENVRRCCSDQRLIGRGRLGMEGMDGERLRWRLARAVAHWIWLDGSLDMGSGP
jgi:hypothetical protein